MASPSMLTTFVAHPSVRMKGTEDHWQPIHCHGVSCDVQQGLGHMHCPMCTRDSHYTDPVILKAHYRVKHVDKGVEFAGLKVLRCCRSCEIIGVISGYKNFKGPHWHCYRCRNGFNRKDEALKHYKTHFKNPQTTFQIQLVQDINQSLLNDNQPTHNHILSMVSAALTTPTTVTLPSISQHMQAGGRLGITSQQQETAMATNGISVAANETIDSNTDTIVLIETTEGNLTPSLQQGGAFPALIQPGTHSTTSTIESNVSRANLILVQEKMKLEQQVEQLHKEMGEMEHRYKIEIQRLKSRVDQLTMSNSNLKHVVDALRKASSKHLPDNDQEELEQLVRHMEEQHSQLLRHHVAQLNLFWSSQHQSASELQVTNPQQQQQEHQRVHIIPMALEGMVSESNGNPQHSATLSLGQNVTMETAEGSYEVTLLPEVTATTQDLNEETAGRASEMTTLSSVTMSYSEDRTLNSSTNGAGDGTVQTQDGQEEGNISNNLTEYQNGKRSIEGDDVVSHVNKKIRDR